MAFITSLWPVRFFQILLTIVTLFAFFLFSGWLFINPDLTTTVSIDHILLLRQNYMGMLEFFNAPSFFEKCGDNLLLQKVNSCLFYIYGLKLLDYQKLEYLSSNIDMWQPYAHSVYFLFKTPLSISTEFFEKTYMILFSFDGISLIF